MSRNFIFGFATVCSLAGMAYAQSSETQTQEVTNILAQIKALHSSLAGKTITATGVVGTFRGDTVYFVNSEGRFVVQFDAGREDRRRIEGCEIALFGDADPKCVFEVDAELAVAKPFTLPDGGEIRLIIFDVK